MCSEEVAIERRVAEVLKAAGARLELSWGFTLYHRDDLPPRTSFKTYSSFRRAVQEEPGATVRPEVPPPRSWRPPPAPVHDEPGAGRLPEDLGFGDLAFPPRDDRAPVEFVGGERVALAWVTTYVSKFLERYYVGATNTMRKGKSAIGRDATTKFSPWLAHGCVSARRIYHLVEKLERQRRASDATGWLKHELVWRDYLRFAGMAEVWGDSIFKRDGIGGALQGIEWVRDGAVASERLERWIEGRTGYPFVDAFMRELAATGYTTHCGRECACWFLVRDLGVDWRLGAAYFESILIDYEPTANWGNWAYRIASTTPPRLLADDGATRSREMLLWAGAHDPHAVHVASGFRSSPPRRLALEPWRLLAAAEGAPPTRRRAAAAGEEAGVVCDAPSRMAEEATCAACEAPRPRLGWGDFRRRRLPAARRAPVHLRRPPHRRGGGGGGGSRSPPGRRSRARRRRGRCRRSERRRHGGGGGRAGGGGRGRGRGGGRHRRRGWGGAAIA